MKKIIFLTGFFCITISALGQTTDVIVDSLQNVIERTESDSLKASAYSSLAWRFIVFGHEISLVKANLDSALVILEKRKDTMSLANLEYKYGVMYRFQGDFDKALGYFEKVLPFYESQQDSSKVTNTHFQIGVVYEMTGDYEKSLTEFLKILKIYETQDNKQGVGLTLNSLGIVYTKLNKYPLATESFKKAIAIHTDLKDQMNVANANSNLADVYMKEGKLEMALENYLIARNINRETKSAWGQSINNQKVSEILVLEEKYAQALPYLNEALQIQKENDYKTEMTGTLAALGLVHLRLKNFSKSEEFLKLGSNNLTDSKEMLAKLHQNFYTLYKETNRFKGATEHLESYYFYKDSLLNEVNIKNINELQIKFETEKKDRELAEQHLEIQEQQTELQKKKNQYTIMTGIAIFLLVSSLLGWFLYQQRQKRKNQEIISLKREQQVKTLESLMEGEEKERFRIAKELHDGVNGDLSAIKYKLTSMLEHNTTVVNEVVAMIDKSCEQVRAISHNLVPPSLEKFNLIEALADYCSTMDEVHEPKIDFQHIGEHPQLSKNNEINIYRIVQELVSNSIKHAEAKRITVQISNRENNIQITIEDNGKGFDPNKVDSKGIGLKNIDSRIDYLNATKDLVSNSKGTSYTLEIDINKLNDN